MTESQRREPSWLDDTWRRALSRTSARFGLAWIGLVTVCAAFAPLLANSRPLLLVQHGQWMSPALQALTPTDAVCLVAAVCFALSLFARIGISRRLLLVSVVSVLSMPLCWLMFDPPRITVYEQYRSDAFVAESAWVVRAPVPFSPRDYQRDLAQQSFQSPSAQHWLGTEENGASVLSRLIHAARIALGIGFIATGLAVLLGILIGGLMGYLAGWADLLGMRLVEVFEAVPTLFLLLAFVAFFGNNLYVLMLIIGVTSWPAYARYVRAEFLRLREQDFVQAARVSGLPLESVLFRHLLPNALAPLLVAMSFGFAAAILAEATLSFLGLGPVDAPSWGQMLNQAVRSSRFVWWMALFPGGAIFMTVLSYNLIGEALRDAVDPHGDLAQ